MCSNITLSYYPIFKCHTILALSIHILLINNRDLIFPNLHIQQSFPFGR